MVSPLSVSRRTGVAASTVAARGVPFTADTSPKNSPAPRCVTLHRATLLRAPAADPALLNEEQGPGRVALAVDGAARLDDDRLQLRQHHPATAAGGSRAKAGNPLKNAASLACLSCSSR